MVDKMTIRFTHTEKWSDEWFLKLPPYQKLLWNFLCDNCDIAGFWEKNLTLASLLTGIPISEIEGAYKGLTRGFVESDRFIWIRKFIKHQKNLPINPDNRCHKAILRSIGEHNSFGDIVLETLKQQIDELNIEGASKGLASPLGKGIGNGKGKGKLLGKCENPFFERFWIVYPRKQVKTKALESFNRINPDEELLQKMITAVEEQKKSDQWQKDKGQFIPMPTTWLNQKRWEDVIKPEITRKSFVAELIAEGRLKE